MHGSIVALSICQWYWNIESAATVYGRMNPLSLRLSNRDATHSYAAKGNYDRLLWWCSTGYVLCVSNDKARNMCPLSYFRTIDTVMGEPLTSPFSLESVTQWLLHHQKWTCKSPRAITLYYYRLLHSHGLLIKSIQLTAKHGYASLTLSVS